MANCNCSSNPCKCKDSVNEHLNRIKRKTAYAINEAKYSLVQDMDEDDNIPEEIWSTQPVSGVDSNVHEDAEDEKPVTPEMPEDQIAAGQEPTEEIPATPTETPAAIPAPEEPSPVDAQKSADELQNEILKTSLTAMQKMHQEMDRLNMTVDSLNAKVDVMNKDVDEVKEPTNVEKLMARKEDSHPFYYNLNDMWDNNWFQARRGVDDSKGIVELEDGSYVADFDTLPKYNDREIKDSFNL